MYDNMKTAIVTGGGKGIGKSITEHLQENGYEVIVGSRTEGICGDVSDPSFHDLLVDTCLEKYGSLDLYVNNAGFSEWQPIETITESFLQRIFEVNLFGAFWGCKSAIRGGVSSIVNISSLAGKRGSANNSAYVATKFGMNGLTQSLAKEVGWRNIRVNAVCPVLVRTDGLISALDNAFPDTEKFLKDFTNTQSALGRLPQGRDVADMVLYLAGASSVTGQCINVDCGVLPS